ncbi:putative collagen-binding domain-containing protein [Caldifermentibacillus hisashii]|uniref:putative collagen-binding domain-containing protein n=1 Tax=Caldifermentibacillus hisashii TaxID=996558 RepID=UPI0034D4720B
MNINKHVLRKAENLPTCIYLLSGGEETVNLNWQARKDLQMWWFNPRDGKCYLQNNSITYNSNEDFCTIKN